MSSKFICDVIVIRQQFCDILQLFKKQEFLIDNQTKSKHTQKQLLKHGLSIYENLIHLQVFLKQYDKAIQLCERFLQTDSTLIEIWLLKIYISLNTSNINEVCFVLFLSLLKNSYFFLFKIIENVLKSCSFDAQIHLNVAQYYVSIVNIFKLLVY